MKYFYTPNDLAVYFIMSDLTVSDERKVINELWEQQNATIWPKYRTSKAHFKHSIYNELNKYDITYDELDELNILLQDLDASYNIDGTINEQGVIESFFKIIKLQLTYTPNKGYRKIKFRNLIGVFGYRRRSAQLVEYIEKTLRNLGLVANLRGFAPCNITEIKLDDTIIIRLKR
ncbi:hypothetical protein SPSYN_02918 [Sporotomaculum syntrophicum]|uniref:Uncharacterized protein n=1 Tax=Sporotomaculum syntrophicum TaxID=182264 RepID=A0A9D2WNH3_9FIRM|nr:hypothetical protein [Sporotomaculum syntrophicum]KAF1084006.1 hypothetical protein SPSYN_02918 [Sporotomaculum syntrophicum]